MIDPDASDDEKLSEARRLFDETVDTYRDFFNEASEDVSFESGDQWNPDDMAILRKEMRPTLTFNLIQSIVDHNIGTIEDAKKAPRAVAVSRNDRFTADVLNDLLDRVRHEINLSSDEMETLYWSTITGIGGLAIDANEDPDRDDYLLISVTPLPFNEFKFDAFSTKADLSDAEFVIRDRWMKESEFKRTYPKQADLWDTLIAEPSDQTTLGMQSQPREPHSSVDTDYLPISDWGINRAKREVRIVHVEYKTTVKIKRATKLTTDAETEPSFMELTQAEIDAMADDKDFKLDYELDEKFKVKTQIRWFEFAGAKTILYDDEIPLPIRGFSIVPLVCRRDRRKRTFQGKVRPLKDPQREVNKRFSQEIHLVNSMAQPGTDIEDGASPMPIDEFERATKSPGGVRRLNAGGLEKIRDRALPEMPMSVSKLHDSAIQMIRVISNTTMDTLLEPRGIPEAAATAQLRHRQSTLAMVPFIHNYQSFQRTVARRLLEIMVNSFSDTQIEDMLSNSDQFTVSGGVVSEAENPNNPSPEGPRTADISSIRALRYNVELVTTAETENSNQLIQLQFLDTAKERDIPIAPDVYIELMPFPRDTKDRLKEYAVEQGKIALQMKQAETAQQQQVIAQATEADRQKNLVDLERIKEERRHNFAAEITQAVSVGFEHQRGMAKVVEDASAEQLGMIQTVLDLVARMQEAKLGAVERGLANGGSRGSPNAQ